MFATTAAPPGPMPPLPVFMPITRATMEETLLRRSQLKNSVPVLHRLQGTYGEQAASDALAGLFVRVKMSGRYRLRRIQAVHLQPTGPPRLALEDIAGTSSLAAPSDTNPFAPDASAAYEQTGRGELQELRQELQAAQAAPGLGLRACAAAVLRKKAVLHWAANLQELVAQFGLAKLRADMQDAARIEQQAVFLAGPQRPSAVLPPPAAALPQQPLAEAASADPALWAAVQQVAALAPDGSQRLPQLQAWPAPAPPVQPPAVPAPSGGAESQPPQQRPPQQAPMALLQPAVALAPGSSIQQQASQRSGAASVAQSSSDMSLASYTDPDDTAAPPPASAPEAERPDDALPPPPVLLPAEPIAPPPQLPAVERLDHAPPVPVLLPAEQPSSAPPPLPSCWDEPPHEDVPPGFLSPSSAPPQRAVSSSGRTYLGGGVRRHSPAPSELPPPWVMDLFVDACRSLVRERGLPLDGMDVEARMDLLSGRVRCLQGLTIHEVLQCAACSGIVRAAALPLGPVITHLFL